MSNRRTKQQQNSEALQRNQK